MTALRILLVPEESSEFSRLVESLTAQTDLVAELAPSIEEALAKLESEQFDAVISGIRIHDVSDGLSFLERVRQLDPLMPFFFFTVESSPEHIATAFQAGAQDYFIADSPTPAVDRIVESVRVNVELSKLLRAQQAGGMRSAFEEKYAGLFEELEEGSLMLNADSGIISYVNESIASTLGYVVDEMIGMRLEDFISSRGGAVPPKVKDFVKQIEGGSKVLETVFRHRDGPLRTFWTHARLLRLSGSPVLLCTCRDITQFEQLEREVISVRNQLRTIVENSADAIIVSREDGIIEFIGGAAPQLFGISPEDRSLRTLDDLFAGQSWEIKRMLDQIGSDSRVTGLESSIVSRWGTRVPVSVAITALPSSDGITRYLFNILDITAQKVAEAENLLAAELIRIVASDLGPVEALPKLIDRVRGTVPIDFGLVVAVESEREALTVIAIYSGASVISLRVGQSLGIEYLPAEEELWRREGIIRNNLQEGALVPLDELLYKEGIRSYVSLPLLEKGRLIGAGHFGSFRSYALNRGHLALFRELAGALSGALLRAQNVGHAQIFRLFTVKLAENMPDPMLLCDTEGMVMEANSAARGLLGKDVELRGSDAGKIMRSFFPTFVPELGWLKASSGHPRPRTNRAGDRWVMSVDSVGAAEAPVGYSIRLQKV
jgi:PAS domain S-box-containing protein